MSAATPSRARTIDVLVFDVTGMDCGDCAKSVERVVGRLPDVLRADVSFGAGTLTVAPQVDTRLSPDDLARAVGSAVDRAGYTAQLRGDFRRMTPNASWWRSRRLAPTAAASVLWIAATILHHRLGQELCAISLLAMAIVAGGYPIARSALAALRTRRIDMNVLMTISVIGAAILGDWSEGALVVVLFSLGTFLQANTLDRTRLAIRALLDITPEEATVVRSGIEMRVASASLAASDIVRVRPGGRLPADGKIVSGYSALDQAAITGESLPVDRRPGDAVFAGSINGSGMIDIRVTEPATSSMLAKIVHLVEEAQGSKAPTQLLIDRFAAIYTPFVVAAAAMVALIGSTASGEAATWVYRAMVLLVIACPCALVISTPVAIVAAVQSATRLGVLVKGGAALEAAGRVTTFVFDKTGTLTVGRPAVVGVVPARGVSETDLIATAAAVEVNSEHPVARSIVARALRGDIPIPASSRFEALPGRGARARVGAADVAVGGERLMREIGLSPGPLATLEAFAREAAAHGRSTVGVAKIAADGAVVLGVVTVADRLRTGAREAVAALRACGIGHVAMLTGDRDVVAQEIATAAGMDEVRAELLPAEKAASLDVLRQRFGMVAMVGDGINDAPALARADVGIAMGMGGTHVALESAGMALMRDDLAALAAVVTLSRRMLSIVRQNVTLSLLTKVLALGLALFGFVNLWIAVLVDVGTSLVVIVNALRLARFTSAPAPKEAGTSPREGADAPPASCTCCDDPTGQAVSSPDAAGATSCGCCAASGDRGTHVTEREQPSA